MHINKIKATKLGKEYKINFEVVPFDEWHFGLNVELEHGNKFGAITNVTNDNLQVTAKIVVAHLLEDPRYYHFLKRMEDTRKKYWKTRKIPNIFYF